MLSSLRDAENFREVVLNGHLWYNPNDMKALF